MSVKERIIKETTKMFALDGVKSIRMDDIAARLGISKRTLYETVGDKEQLIWECCEYYQVKMEERTNELASGATNVIEEFLIMMEYWDKHAGTNYQLMSDIRKFYPKVYKRLEEEHANEGFKKLRNKLLEGVEQGYLLDNIDLDMAVAVFTYSLYGIINQDALLMGNVSEREAFKYVITYFFRGIATEKGINLIDARINENN